jgi:hypothetical protein
MHVHGVRMPVVAPYVIVVTLNFSKALFVTSVGMVKEDDVAQLSNKRCHDKGNDMWQMLYFM